LIKIRERVYKNYSLIFNALIIPIALYLSFYIRFNFFPAPKGIPSINQYLLFFIITFLVHGLIFHIQGFFKFKLKKNLLDTLFEIFFNYIVTLFISTAVLSYFKTYRLIDYEISRGFIAAYFIIGFVLTTFINRLLRFYLKRSYRLPKNRHKGLIIGAGKTGIELAKKLSRYKDWGIDIIGFIDERKNKTDEDINIIGKIDELGKIIDKYSVKDIFITLPLKDYDNIIQIIKIANNYLVNVKLVPDIIHLLSIRAELQHIEEIPLINLNDIPLKGWRAISKRVFDIFISLFGLIFVAPLLFIVFILVKLTSKGPVFYIQKRMGIDGNSFKILKFRTMIPDAEAKTGAVWAPRKNDPRITPVGKFLRKYSIDELPQLINVLKGEMSLVGPRPERPIFVNKFKEKFPHYMLRHKVKSGMTGWAQVNGFRGNTSLEERIKYDLYYIENWSFKFDFRILWMTIKNFGFVDPNL